VELLKKAFWLREKTELFEFFPETIIYLAEMTFRSVKINPATNNIEPYLVIIEIDLI
jgi:hypothetical protein